MWAAHNCDFLVIWFPDVARHEWRRAAAFEPEPLPVVMETGGATAAAFAPVSHDGCAGDVQGKGKGKR